MSVKVAVRVRPFNAREQKLGCECVVDMQDPTTILKPYKGEAQRKFTFDYSFWSFDGFQTQPDGFMKANPGSKYADQRQVFERIGQSILDNAWQGYHCCLFAYGQTGSGKSYSMIGFGTNKGIVPITCSQIFQRMKNKQAGIQYSVQASMLEIYNEQVQDLTIPIKDRPAGGLSIRENKLLGVYVDGVKKHAVTTYAQIQNVMDMGTKNRTVAATQMNATSSRAHTIITVQFRQIKKVGESKSEKVSMINLVDLAGSQRQDKTGATGQRFKQAVGINQSLTSLGQVISILAKNSEGGKDFVPYRNSALTRILENALGGNSQTIMICAVSPANDNYDETLSTLRYADQAKKIKNKPIVNESATDKLIRQLKEQNERLKKMMDGKGMTNVQGDGTQVNSEQIKKKQEQMRKKQQQMKKKEEEAAKKQKQQLEKLKKLQDQLAAKEKEKQLALQKQKQEADALQKKLKDAEANDQDYQKVKKELEEKKKLDEQKDKKRAEQEAALLTQQKEQEKIMEQQKLMLQKAQDQHKKYMEQAEKKLKQSQQAKKKGTSKESQDIQASINKVNEALNQLKMNQEEIKKKAANDQQEMNKANEDETIFSKKGLKELEQKQKTLPPYFENISKDIMINRKMKLILQKNVINIGKAGCSPPNDIVFGGRDVVPRHATIHIIDRKVFLKPLSKECHLYVNGKKITETIELVNLDRVIFGWNSCYLFKNKHDNRSDEKINDKQITWDFLKTEVEKLVDIDQSDTEDGGSCCSLF